MLREGESVIPAEQAVRLETAAPAGYPFAPKLPGRIPSLDGLRAISIVLVVLSHASGTVNFESIQFLRDLGNFGVRVFFVISGFLITTLLLKEQAKTGGISIRNFYLRRTFRIFPAFYFFVAVIGALNLSGMVSLLPGDLTHALTYTMNYHHPHAWYMGHIWSLSVEEQFYLLWPATLALVGLRKGFRFAFAVVLAAPFLRYGTWLWITRHEGTDQQFQNIADALAVGCLMAGLFNLLSENPRYQRFLRSRWFYLAPLAAFAANATQGHPRVWLFAGQTAATLAIALCIDRFVRYPNGLFGRFLNWAPLRFVGLLSYSLYLWQQVFINRNSNAAIAAFPLNVILAFAAALVSYYLIERPFLRLKDRIHA